MSQDKLYKINEFASLFGTTVKTLRFYEKIGLFMPYYVDKNNGYRYYNYQQIDLFSEIAQFKEIGLSLNEIKKMLDVNIKIDEKLKVILSQKEKLDQFLLKIDKLKCETNKVYFIDAPDIYVYSISKVFRDINDVIETYNETCSVLIDKKIRLKIPCTSVLGFQLGTFSINDFYATLSICVEKCESPLIEKIPKGKYLCMIFKGEIPNMDKAYEFFFSYFEKYNLTIPKIVYEFYEISCMPTSYSNPYIIEIRAKIDEPVLT